MKHYFLKFKINFRRILVVKIVVNNGKRAISVLFLTVLCLSSFYAERIFSPLFLLNEFYRTELLEYVNSFKYGQKEVISPSYGFTTILFQLNRSIHPSINKYPHAIKNKWDFLCLTLISFEQVHNKLLTNFRQLSCQKTNLEVRLVLNKHCEKIAKVSKISDINH